MLFRSTDPVSYVRAHAIRALGELGRLDQADRISSLLGDGDWWVRLAAREALEMMGSEVWPVLVRCLDHRDKFVRNGAAEVVQNLGVLDSLIVMEAATGRTVGKLIMDDSLYTTALTTVSNLQDTATDLRATIGDAKIVIADARAGKGTLGKLLTDDKLYTETTESMSNLKEILQKVNRGDGTIGKLVNEKEFYNNAKLTLQKLDKATESLEDQGPISVIGTLFQTFY